MAFLKKCFAHISLCIKCGKAANIFLNNNWFCEDCSKKEEKDVI